MSSCLIQSSPFFSMVQCPLTVMTISFAPQEDVQHNFDPNDFKIKAEQRQNCVAYSSHELWLHGTNLLRTSRTANLTKFFINYKGPLSLYLPPLSSSLSFFSICPFTHNFYYFCMVPIIIWGGSCPLGPFPVTAPCQTFFLNNREVILAVMNTT